MGPRGGAWGRQNRPPAGAAWARGAAPPGGPHLPLPLRRFPKAPARSQPTAVQPHPGRSGRAAPRRENAGRWRAGREGRAAAAAPTWIPCRAARPRDRRAYLGCRRTCPRPAGWRPRRPWRRCGEAERGGQARTARGRTAPVGARRSLPEAAETEDWAPQPERKLPPRGAAPWGASSRPAPSEDLWAGSRLSPRPRGPGQLRGDGQPGRPSRPFPAPALASHLHPWQAAEKGLGVSGQFPW